LLQKPLEDRQLGLAPSNGIGKMEIRRIYVNEQFIVNANANPIIIAQGLNKCGELKKNDWVTKLPAVSVGSQGWSS
jgi:hypothetical protein